MPEKPKVEICAGVASLDGNRIPLQNVELLKVIDSGAHGTVFEGLDLNLGRKIAVKLWYRTGETVHEGAVAEARKLAMVSHPLFATVYHFDAIGTTPYSVMELLQGHR